MKYVRMCACNGWFVETWKKGEEGESRIRQYRCRSWRHAGDCARWKGAQDFCRIRDAIKSLNNWTLLTLTYAQRGRVLDGTRFREGLQQWAKLRKRLIYDFGPLKYIQTWEVHKSGWPHVHCAVSNADLHRLAEYDQVSNFINLVQAHAMAVGFGERGTLDAMRSPGLLAGYLGKLARELADSSVKSQIPVNAPPHFRRLRASRYLLPPVLRNEDYTGRLMSISDNGELEEVKKRK